MKKNEPIKALLFVFLVFFLGSCCSLKKMSKKGNEITFTLSPKILELHGDSVQINISAKFPPKYFCPKSICEIKPVLKCSDGTEITLKTVKVQGEKVKDNYKVIKYADGGTVNYSTKVQYQDKMRVCDVVIKASLEQKNKTIEMTPVVIGKGTITTPLLLDQEGKMIYANYTLNRNITDFKEGTIYYVINRYDLRPQELSKPEIKSLQSFLKSLPEKERVKLKSIEIYSYASPDGPEKLNENLSINRGKTSSKVILDIAKGDKYKDLDITSSIFAKNTAEDWDGFKKELEKSDIPDKDLVLRVLSMYADPIQRELEIKKMSKVYKELADKVLPKLRRGEIKIIVDSIGRDDNEIIQTFNTNPQLLSVEELLHGATLQKHLKDKYYEAALQKEANDWRIYNNLAIAKFENKSLNEAKEYLEKAKNLKPGEKIILNNLGVLEIKNNNFSKAEEYFKISGNSPETRYNLGIIYLKKGDYSSALNMFGNECSFNAALSKLLAGQLDQVTKTIDCSPDKDSDKMYYLKAIVGARQQNTDLMYNSLRAAISKNPNWASYAKTDLEFEKYFSDDTFKSIVK